MSKKAEPRMKVYSRHLSVITVAGSSRELIKTSKTPHVVSWWLQRPLSIRKVPAYLGPEIGYHCSEIFHVFPQYLHVYSG
jgi:hypothetical protein